MRIASLLPAATEMACALGLEDRLCGISFECNYPQSITRLPRLVTTAIDTHRMTPREIDIAVTARMREGKGLYAVDEKKLAELRPDIILTQDLCQVCAPSGNELSHALAALDYQPQVIFMSPHSLSDIAENLRDLAKITGTQTKAEELIAGWQQRIEAVKSLAPRHKPRVFLMEWVDPVYCSGHWLAEMITLAGGEDKFARRGEDSVRITWEELAAWQPEIIVVAPCGYNKEQADAQLPLLSALPGWNELPAVKNNRVHTVDADAYFVRPGPRVIEGLEILSGLFRR